MFNPFPDLSSYGLSNSHEAFLLSLAGSEFGIVIGFLLIFIFRR